MPPVTTNAPVLRRPAFADGPLWGPGTAVELDEAQRAAVAWASEVGAGRGGAIER